MSLMPGVRLVRAGIAEYLSIAYPKQREAALATWPDTEPEDLPLPARYDAYEPDGIGTDTMALVGINVATASNFRHVGYNNRMEEHYSIRYAVTVYGWCYTPNLPQEGADGAIVPSHPKEKALEARDDMGALLRSALLSGKALGYDEVFNIVENTMTEAYSDPAQTESQSGRWLAGVTLSFNLDVDESLYREVLGAANTITVEGSTIPSTQ